MKKIFFIVLLLSLPVHAKIFSAPEPKATAPFSTRSQNPLYLQFISDRLEKTETLPIRHYSSSVEFGLSNLFERRRRVSGTGIDLDMELYRTEFSLHYGLTHNYEIGLDMPFISFSGGFLDPIIQAYHNAFGLPNAGRNRVEDNRFSYLITQNGSVLYEVDRSGFGPGDLVLYQKIKIREEGKFWPALAVKALIKLPTGSPTEGTGSGNADSALSLLGDKSWGRFHTTTQIGVAVLGDHERLKSIQKSGAVHFGQAFGFNLSNNLSLVAQITGNTPYFENVTIPELSDPVLDLTFGLSGEKNLQNSFRKIRYAVAFTEDPLTFGPSVDFTLTLKAGLEF
ncbi:MAG: DUF3187 family protein [Deltaproteobacteria bacterium]|nr:DUF3187 family protein [Deltaproteobacteria bacterium]